MAPRRNAVGKAAPPVGVLFTVVLPVVSALASLAVASQPAESICAREVPSGSTVNPSAGTVTMANGSVVAVAKFPCSMTSFVWGRPPLPDNAIGQYLSLALMVAVAATVLLYYFVVTTRGPTSRRSFVAKSSKRTVVFAAIGGLAVTALSALLYAGGSLETDVWGFPSGYFVMESLPGSNGFFVSPLPASFDFLFWFLLCVAAVGAISLGWNRARPVAHNTKGELNPTSTAKA